MSPADRSLRSGTRAMLVGTAVSAVAAYLFQVIGGRALGADAFAPVSVIWSMLFIGFTVFVLPVEQLVIRRLVFQPGAPRPLAGAGRTIALVIATAAVLAVAFTSAVKESLLDGGAGYVPVAGVMFIVYGAFGIARGFLAGSHRFVEYGLVVGLDATLKVVGAVAVALTGWGPVALSWVLALSPIVVLSVRPFQRTVTQDLPQTEQAASDLRFMGGFLVATAASQTVLAAGPLVVGALGATSAAISVFFVTTTLFRGPMSAAYNLIARVLPAATRRVTAGDDAILQRWAWRILIAGLGLAILVGVAGWLMGPPVIELLYGSEFRPGEWLTAYAAAGVTAGMAGLATTQLLVARGNTGRMAVVWLGALAAAAITLAVVSGDETSRVAAAFFVGEAVALVGLSAAALVPNSR